MVWLMPNRCNSAAAGVLLRGSERSVPVPQAEKPGIHCAHLVRCVHQANASHPVSAYGATKYAVRGLAQQVAVEYASYGIRANSVSSE